MWSLSEGHPTAEKVESIILKRLTVEWPNDERLREVIKTRPLYGASTASYVVKEYDRSLGVGHPNIPELTIEHIMPRSYSKAWGSVISVSKHGKVKDLWANLIPLSQSMNNSVAQETFDKKKVVFECESMFKSARVLGETHAKWDEDEILLRSERLAGWATERWKRS